MMALIDMKTLRRTPILAMIEQIHKELDERQAAGHLRKDFCSVQKNDIAVRFVELFDHIKQN